MTTCPADVMKTRVMTAAAEKAVDPKKILIDLVQNEGIGEHNAPYSPRSFESSATVSASLLESSAEHACQEGKLSGFFQHMRGVY